MDKTLIATRGLFYFNFLEIVFKNQLDQLTIRRLDQLGTKTKRGLRSSKCVRGHQRDEFTLLDSIW